MLGRVSGISEELETDLGHDYTAALKDLGDDTKPALPPDGLHSLQTAHLSHPHMPPSQPEYSELADVIVIWENRKTGSIAIQSQEVVRRMRR